MSGRYESFVVRIWRRGRRLIRGEVTHVPSGDARRFTELSDVTEFINERVATASLDSEEATGDGIAGDAQSMVGRTPRKEPRQQAAHQQQTDPAGRRRGMSEQREMDVSFPRRGPEGDGQRFKQ